MSSTQQRDRVSVLARTNFDQAYNNARQIDNPWFRAQSLAAVLRHAPENKVSSLSKEAFVAASNCKDAYQQVRVASWAVRALIERGDVHRVGPYLLDILAKAHNITPPPSKVEALFLFWSAVWIAPSLRQPTFALLLQVCERANTWRAGRAMGAIVLIVAGEDRAKAEEIWNRMPENRYKRQARRELDVGRTCSVRGVFHS